MSADSSASPTPDPEQLAGFLTGGDAVRNLAYRSPRFASGALGKANVNVIQRRVNMEVCNEDRTQSG
jgi:hypothetical protein